MCSFLYANNIYSFKEDGDYNKYLKYRGPDYTGVLNKESGNNKGTFVHNLLSITGEFTEQPFENEDIVCIYNGEIYNYEEFGNYKSDGECLIPLYKKYGTDFIKQLDGEFAICLADYSKNILIVSSDVFGTKPLFTLSGEDGTFAVSTYQEPMEDFIKPQIKPSPSKTKFIKPNTTLIYSLPNHELIEEKTVYDFDLNQHKTTYDDWIKAFEKSIEKRSKDLTKKSFLGLSSGYDSGAISCELTKQKRKFRAYSIMAEENPDILKRRNNLIDDMVYVGNNEESIQAIKHISHNAPTFSYSTELKKHYFYKNDQAAYGLGLICQKGNREGYKVYFSGQGADEILSDYGMNGRRLWPHSEFGGKYPEDLTKNNFFPWLSFFDGSQIQYMSKEEYVAGSYGIETRYPFLDTKLVQEFLWLTPELKNKKYKAPLLEYLKRNNWPTEENSKRGFSALWGMSVNHPRHKINKNFHHKTDYNQVKVKYKNEIFMKHGKWVDPKKGFLE